MDVGTGKRVQIEFVSVNPTGPVHVGHARGAVLGSGLARALSAAGFDVTREYYVNDAGNQMELFLPLRVCAVRGGARQDGRKGA